ncbi:copper chaperone PCu(A)C [Rhodovulum steppense]|uniref:Copper(I)-binding protein n=1 Tax=Rhodovulum steppense TaxID=540251 RepID=A0A4R1YUZ7_9RHOB|nr:copper chaperone PCu(A)C [Rhodovulum steppense]TCM84603.1 hypothetical protein EV216_11185 [Rhodovulum steppense]
MSPKTFLLAGALVLAPVLPALADNIEIHDPYARASTMMSQSGAAFMVLVNTGAEEDRLVSATSDVAERVELHTHEADANGVMRMVEVEEGFAIPAGGSHALKRGADHVMFLGLTRPLAQGDSVTVTLTFEKAGEMVVEIPVDMTRGSPAAPPKGHSH